MVKLPCSGHDTRCCILDSLEFCQQTVTDPIQQTVTVIKTATDTDTDTDWAMGAELIVSDAIFRVVEIQLLATGEL